MSWLERFSEFCIRRRLWVAGTIIGAAVVCALFTVRLEIRTIFHDMLPTHHDYIKVNDEYDEQFGGPNVVTIMVQATEGDIFQMPVLETIQKVTEAMYYVPSVNNFQIASIAARKLRSIEASAEGIESIPLMWPDLPQSQEEIDLLRERVLANPLVYGQYVSADLSSAIVTVDFLEHRLDYRETFDKLMQTVHENEGDHVDIKMVGNPVLTGWVIYYLPETLRIVMITLMLMVVVLFITVRSVRGIVVPLIAGATSGAYALGISALFGINFDPLVIVIAFLVTARNISHSIQMLAAWDDRIGYGENAKLAGQRTLYYLFRPGALGVATDAGGVAIVGTMPMPLLQKIAFTGTIWISSIVITGIILTPVLLSWVKNPHAKAFPFPTERLLEPVLRACGRIVLGPGAYVVLVLAALVFGTSGYYATQVTVGDSRPGTPILWPDHVFNRDAADINARFPGSDQMFVVVKTEAEDWLKRPDVLSNMDEMQRYLEAQPEIGATTSLVDLLEPVNASLNEGNRRFQEIGGDAEYNAGLLFMYMQGIPPEDYGRFTGPHFDVGSIIVNFRDHKGDTIRTAVSRIEEYIENNPLPGDSQYKLAGGLVGVLAAVNEEVFARQVESIALALLTLFVLSAIAYRSTVAGLFYMPLVVMSNTITFAFMAWKGIGMNINTLPVAALGIGLGVDYAFYVVDGVKERFEETGDVMASIRGSLLTAGRGVLITGATMIASVLVWYASSLKFQAEMGLLMALWLTVSAISSLLLIPAMIYVFRPAFVFGEGKPQQAAQAAPA